MIFWKNSNIKAFTLVELIVVITILAILATVGFVSFSWYLAWARDTNRIAQLKSMSDALELYRTKKDLPIPDDKVDVQASGSTIAYQWYIWANVLETIEYTEKGLDPKDKSYFSYYLTKDKKAYQLMNFLEDANEDVLAWIFNDTKAVDYEWRVPKVLWKKLWILTDDENTPIQDISSIQTSWFLDVALTFESYISHLSDEKSITGTWFVLKPLWLSLLNWKQYRSCKEIRDNEQFSENENDMYFIRPEWYPLFQVYCDMTDDWWWWTRYVEIKGNYTWDDASDCADRLERIDNDTLSCFYPYKMWKFSEFKYIDKSVAGQSDPKQIYKTVVDNKYIPADGTYLLYSSIYDTSIFDSMQHDDSTVGKFIRFGLNYKHVHSQCWKSRHPWWMAELYPINPYMNYDISSSWPEIACSWPEIASADWWRESTAREWEFYVR